MVPEIEIGCGNNQCFQTYYALIFFWKWVRTAIATA